MKKCDCYCVEEQIIGWHTPVDPKITIVHKCNGTKERDLCSCGGDRTKCDFYPEVRQRALKEQEPKFGEWISVEDRLPDEDGMYLVHYHDNIVGEYVITREYWGKAGKFAPMEYFEKHTGRKAMHWMPLPTPPEKETNQ